MNNHKAVFGGDWMKITILCDNEALEGFNSDRAFSCLVEAHGKRILFDTSEDGYLLVQNMLKIGGDLRGIDAIFLSHDHFDHAGAVCYLLNLTGSLPVFVPCSFDEDLKVEINKRAELVEIKDAAEIMDGFYSTGALGSNKKEQSLIVKTDKGNVVICGCSHPGLENILAKARERGEVYGVLGGFHGFDKFEALEGLKMIVPCHCTKHKQEIFERFPKECLKGGAGKVFDL